MDTYIFRYAGWFAYASATVWSLQLLFLGLFYTVGKPFGLLSDIANVIMVLLILPYALALHKIYQPGTATFSLVALLAAIIGIVSVALGSALLVFGIIDFQQSVIPTLIGLGFIGIWLMGSNYLSQANGAFPGALVILGIAVGSGLVLLAAIAPFAGAFFVDTGISFPKSPFVYLPLAGGLVGFVGYPVWAVWLGRLVSSGRVTLA